jgi:hypothetical protein
MATSITLREATTEDIPALLSMLLTSFRRFPLFDYLYAPIRTDQANALDTLYFWDKRLRKTLWDPLSTIIVAEIRDCNLPSAPLEIPTRQIDQDSWGMLRWIYSSKPFPLSDSSSGTALFGFSIWRWQGVVQANQGKRPGRRSYADRFQGRYSSI